MSDISKGDGGTSYSWIRAEHEEEGGLVVLDFDISAEYK